MKVVALVSGGKDSCYNMMQCVAHGHEIVALANLKPSRKDELDSYMYQTVGHHAIDLYSEAMGLPLYRRTIEGEAVEQGKDYAYNSKDEVEDLYQLLKSIMREVKFDGVAAGAILSNYQRVRVENVCSRLGLTCLAYLWRRDQKELLAEMISCHVDAIIIKVAAIGLEPQKHLEKKISEMFTHLCQLNKEFDCHMCGEGGEYETFTLDCPLFQKKIVIDSSEVIIHSDDAFAPVGYVNFKEMHLEDKNRINKAVDENKLKLEALKDISIYRGDTRELNTQGINDLHRKIHLEDNLAVSISDVFCPGTPACCGENEGTELKANEDAMIKWSEGFFGVSGIKVRFSTESIEDQTEHAMKRLKKTLEGFGSSLQHVTLVHVYVKSMSDYAAFNSVYLKHFHLNPPSRVCVQTNFLDSTVFQLDCLGMIHSDNGDCSELALKREAMHVQSISHWAPANIGPYSQAVKVNERTCFVAGCIGLWPSSMKIINGGINNEAPLALRHVQNILKAFVPGTTLSDVIYGVCYVTNQEYVSRARAVWWNYCEKQGGGDCGEDVMQYVVVPALPKGALVEWHAVAHHCQFERKCNELSVDDFKNITVSLTNFSCPRHKCGSLNASVEIRPPIHGKSDVTIPEMVAHFLETFENFIASCGLQWSSTLLLRIFFRTDIFKDTHDKLEKAFRMVLQKKHQEQCPVLCFVPISRLKKTTQVLAVGCWFQTRCSKDDED